MTNSQDAEAERDRLQAEVPKRFRYEKSRQIQQAKERETQRKAGF